MKRSFLLAACVVGSISFCHSQAILTRMDSLKLPQASIWGGISHNGENISITTTLFQGRAHLFLRKIDTALRQVGSLVQLTFDADPVTAKHITDHKHLFLNGFHFITFSVAGDSDLYIFKVDKNGTRMGAIVPVVEHTSDRTNDMMFTTDGTFLFVAYFRPTAQSIVHTLDQSLTQIVQPIITSSRLPHNNLGTMLYRSGKFFMFTGDKAGPASNLILTVWNRDWSPAISQPQLLIPTKTGEGLAFPTGIALDTVRRRWYVGFHHMQNVNPDNTTHIDMAVFDENFSLLEHQHRSPGFRPHFLLLGDSLYSVFDQGGVFLERYRVRGSSGPGQPISWKQYFTLSPHEGTEFVADTAAIVPGGGVPVLNITNDGKIVLTSAGGPQLAAFEVNSTGRTYTPTTIAQRGPDGGFVYLPDGRTRFLSEEPAPGRTPQRHKSRIVSWISSDGRTWTRESGIRYQPGTEDDSIASVVSTIQVRDSVWRMYFVGDWYRTNGTRTALSHDWGLTWQQESRVNILRRGDVDPHPVYLADGRVRLYFRAGMNQPPDRSGVGYCDSDDGLRFDTTKVKLLVSDAALPAMLKLDPAVMKLPSGDVVCYIGAAPFFNQSGSPKLIAAWGKKPAVSVERREEEATSFELLHNFPNPFNGQTEISYSISFSAESYVQLKVFNILGREVATIFEGERAPGVHRHTWNAEGHASGIYICRIVGLFGSGRGQTASRVLLLIK